MQYVVYDRKTGAILGYVTVPDSRVLNSWQMQDMAQNRAYDTLKRRDVSVFPWETVSPEEKSLAIERGDIAFQTVRVFINTFRIYDQTPEYVVSVDDYSGTILEQSKHAAMDGEGGAFEKARELCEKYNLLVINLASLVLKEEQI